MTTRTRPRRQGKRASPLQEAVTAALDDMKAVNVKVLDVRGLTDIADTMVIASGNSDRHVRSIAESVVERAKEAGVRPLGTEGERDGEWVLVDLQDSWCTSCCHACASSMVSSGCGKAIRRCRRSPLRRYRAWSAGGGTVRGNPYHARARDRRRHAHTPWARSACDEYLTRLRAGLAVALTEIEPAARRAGWRTAGDRPRRRAAAGRTRPGRSCHRAR